MKDLPESLSNILEKYATLQARQLRSFETDELPDISRLSFERATAFERLKEELTHLLLELDRQNTDSPDLAASIKARIAAVLERDGVLMEKITEHRERLRAHMEKMQNGKKALRGYGGGGMGGPPRYMNNTG